MKKLITIAVVVFASLLAHADESVSWSLAGGLGWSAYTQGGSGTYGQSFLDLQYRLSPETELGLSYQYGTSFNELAVEFDYLFGGNYYFGLQAGPTSYGSSSGVAFGPMFGADWKIANSIKAGFVIIYQGISWSSGSNNNGMTYQSAVNPYGVITYYF